ncbi:hypothetical protein RSO68_08160 [Halomonas saccharevitans]|uniref:Uncharacterized protein n=1 Tax=Halomonas saccharevitans TaxID=416872 RepID=A0A1I7C855_9GAMM|nr:hypothetical protein [Halomonas saccharevitans]MDT8879439.1 hypothetical protein [Halomonas saccharevitans]SFT95564.1 hypothetical protein SAMN04487956_13811 [Halomonas saccharevitans]
MDTRDSKTPEEELQHLKEVSQPEDFEHPEPDAEQPEARQDAGGMSWLLLVLIGAVAAVVIGLLVFGLGG